MALAARVDSSPSCVLSLCPDKNHERDPMYRYRHGAFGLVSDLALPDLVSDAVVPADPADFDAGAVRLRLRPVPQTLSDPDKTGLLWQVAGDEVLFSLGEAGRYLVRGGQSIEVAPGPDHDSHPDRLLNWLYGSVFAAVLLQRGLMPLHVASLRTAAGLLAITGPSGAGKSTMAGALLSRGHALLADDLLQIDDVAGLMRPESGTAVTGWPGVPRLRLSDEAIAAFGLGHGNWVPVEGRNKSGALLPLGGEGRPDRAPGPLAALVELAAASDAEAPARLERLTGLDAIRAIHGALYRPGLSQALLGVVGLRAFTFNLTARLPVWRLTRPLGFDRIDAGINALAPLLGRQG